VFKFAREIKKNKESLQKMKPRREPKTLEIFKVRLEAIINKSHPLVKLSDTINWKELEKKLSEKYAEKMGAPGKEIRLMVGLQYLKYMYNESDEMIVQKFVENPYYQYFCGNEYFEHSLPIDSSSMTRFRKRMGTETIEELFKETIKSAESIKQIKEKDFEQLNVDTTVEEKAISFPTDAKLYCKMLEVLVEQANKKGITLRQSYKFVSKKALTKQAGYAHAKQMKRARKMTKKLKTYLGRVYRDIIKKAEIKDEELIEKLSLAEKLLRQTKESKNKLYSIHAPEVECISKGKAHKRYEFGCKVSMVTTSKNNWVVAIQAHHGNPYDGHTLKSSIEKAEEMTRWKAKNVNVDLGYRGHDYDGQAQVNIANRLRMKNKAKSLIKWLKRRSAIEPIFGHLKSDNRLDRNLLKGKDGDHINALLAACGFNLRKLYAVFFLPILEWLDNRITVKYFLSVLKLNDQSLGFV
jgi:IS5 family transposase